MDAKELESYKARLEDMRSRLIGQVGNLKEAILETISPPGEVSLYHTHLADDGASGASGLDRNIILAQNEQGLLSEVEEALRRVEQGTFGPCEDCQVPIDRERLDALPYTRLCIHCARREPDRGDD